MASLQNIYVYSTFIEAIFNLVLWNNVYYMRDKDGME